MSGQSGHYDTLFEVYQQTKVQNGNGQLKDDWLKVGKFWGRIEPISTNAFVASGAESSSIVCRVKMRRSDFPVKADNRICNAHTREVYDVKGVLPIPHDNENALPCSLGSLST